MTFMITDKKILRENIIRLCRAEIGTSDGGNNLTKYGIWYGWNGVAWCCIFVSFIFDSLGFRLKVFKHKKGFAHTDEIIKIAKEKNLFTENPKKGDLIVMDFDGKRPIDHIGIFEKFTSDKNKVFLFEGNTSPGNLGSQDNGDVVAYKVRELSKLKEYYFINIDYFLQP